MCRWHGNLSLDLSNYRKDALLQQGKVDIALVVIEDGIDARDLITYDGME